MQEVYELNGITYKFKVMPPTTALPLGTDLLNILGGSVGNVQLSSLQEEANEESTNAAMLSVITGTLKTIDGKTLIGILDRCKGFIFVDGEICASIDASFNKKLPDLFKVFGMFIAFTFSDFFSESLWGSLLEKGKKIMESNSLNL